MKRIERWRWFGTAGLAVGAVALLTASTVVSASAAPAGDPCTLVQMSTVDGGDNLLLGTDGTGRYQVGVRVYWDSQGVYREHLIRWHDGTPELGPQLDTIGAEFEAIGASGVAVGFRTLNGHRRAAAYAYGQIVTLKSVAGNADTRAVAVNATGQITGGTLNDQGIMDRVLVWSPDGGVVTRTPPAGSSIGQAMDIDDDGTVLGVATNDPYMGSDSRATVWLPDGTPRILPGVLPAKPDALSYPLGIRGGKVFASQETPTGSQLVEWDVKAGTAPRVLDTDGVAGSSVSAVNTRGSILVPGQESAYALLQNGLLRPLPLDLRTIARHDALTDNDVVYGAANGNLPVYANCTQGNTIQK